MAENDLQVVSNRTDFYRDSIGKVIVISISMIVAILILLTVFLYLYLAKPKPILFNVDNEWRVKPAVPLSDPYLSVGDMLQWVGDAIQQVFRLDYYHYDTQVKNAAHYFTEAGYKVFLNQLNIYANYNTVQTNKLFVNATPAFAPMLLQKGIFNGRYAWRVSFPITLNYVGASPGNSRYLELEILVVRVPTLMNLDGVAIENIIVTKSSSS